MFIMMDFGASELRNSSSFVETIFYVKPVPVLVMMRRDGMGWDGRRGVGSVLLFDYNF